MELKTVARSTACPDKELIAFLTFGGYDYSADTPPISWFAPHSVSLYTHWQVFADNINKEIEQGWMQGHYDFIPTLPFRVVTGAAIPRKRQPDKFHTIWNALVRGPLMACSEVGNGNGMNLPIVSSSAAALPPYLAMTWLSIERVCVLLQILADIAITAVEELYER